MKFKLNGVEKTFDGDSNLSLLKYLREHEYLISQKDGCSPQAACGACTVELNGKAVLSCSILACGVTGDEITTIEGLANGEELHPVQKSFIDMGAVQCGFCTPGMILTAYGLLQENPQPSYSEILQGMDDNLCRCGAHKRIVQAIQDASKEMKGVS